MYDISKMTNITRLYQIYLMTYDTLRAQSKSKLGIEQDTLKKLKEISLQIYTLILDQTYSSIQELKNYGDVYDIYQISSRLDKMVSVIENLFETKNKLTHKYGEFSIIPLVLENSKDNISEEKLSILTKRRDIFDTYIKNEGFLKKLKEEIIKLNEELGNLSNKQDEINSIFTKYEKELQRFIQISDDFIELCKDNSIDIKQLQSYNDIEFNAYYDNICSSDKDATEKYNVMLSIPVNNDYSDIHYEVKHEMEEAKLRRSLIEIVKEINGTYSNYEELIKKREKINKYLKNIENKELISQLKLLIDRQIRSIQSYHQVELSILNIKDDVSEKQTLVDRLTSDNENLKKDIEYILSLPSIDYVIDKTKSSTNNMVIGISDSFIAYTKDRVKNVLLYVYNELNKENNSIIKNSIDNYFNEKNKEENIKYSSNEIIDIKNGYIVYSYDRVIDILRKILNSMNKNTIEVDNTKETHTLIEDNSNIEKQDDIEVDISKENIFLDDLKKDDNKDNTLEDSNNSILDITKENNESSNTITENIVQEENNKDNYEFPNIDLDNKKDDVILSSDKTIDNEGFWPVKDIDISVLGIDNLE
ncbi:unknown [Clostridium sp. CAG:914]|mgnify:FL=1|jgi:hypothetical protein|nr:hypothetical protein [Clostridium sp.]CDE96093.1 unknown [Clostridium sp. CAG:914]